MEDTSAIMVILGLLNLIIVGFLIPINNRIKSVDDQVKLGDRNTTALRLHIAENYVKKSDLEKQLDSINTELKELILDHKHIRQTNHEILNILNGLVNAKYGMKPNDIGRIE